MAMRSSISLQDLLTATSLPRHEAERLLAVAAGTDRTGVATGASVTPGEARTFHELAARRLAGEPLQYLEGTVQFGPIEVAIDARALVPRPETEQLWETAVRALEDAGPGTVIVDLCTGSGNLALALQHSFPQARVFATDVSPGAVALARENAARTGLDITVLQGDLFAALPRELMGRIDLLVSNPPYVAEEEFASLPIDVREHEPRGALVAGADGLAVIERIADEAYWWLGIGGHLVCEIGETQGEAVAAMFGAVGGEVRRDLTGRDRFIVGRKGAPCCV
jgi:release factor glutamine methyltransferase